LQDRITEALSSSAHTHVDWTALLKDAGFALFEQHTHELVARADTRDGAQYVSHQLRAQLTQLEDDLTGEELARLDGVISAVENRASEASYRSSRAVLVAI